MWKCLSQRDLVFHLNLISVCSQFWCKLLTVIVKSTSSSHAASCLLNWILDHPPSSPPPKSSRFWSSSIDGKVFSEPPWRSWSKQRFKIDVQTSILKYERVVKLETKETFRENSFQLNFTASGSFEWSKFLYPRRTIKFIFLSSMLIGLMDVIVIVSVHIYLSVIGQLRQTLTMSIHALLNANDYFVLSRIICTCLKIR